MSATITECKSRGGATAMTHVRPLPSRAHQAPSIDPANHCRHSTFDRPAHNVSGTAVSNRDPPIRHFFQKAEEPGNEREFSNACTLANPSHGTLRRHAHALGVVRGDEPDCPGKRNLLTALIGLQRAADRRGNHGMRFRALVLQARLVGPSAIANSRASSIPPPQAMSRSKSRGSSIRGSSIAAQV